MIDGEDNDRPLAQRRTKRLNRLLPKRFRDELPAPPGNLPPVLPPGSTESTVTPSTPLRVLKVIRTPRNVFGLVRKYFVDKLPSHDPEEALTLDDLISYPVAPPATHDIVADIYPYPNETSWRLGNWFWNGFQKSKRSFTNLINIVGDPDFKPEDV